MLKVSYFNETIQLPYIIHHKTIVAIAANYRLSIIMLLGLCIFIHFSIRLENASCGFSFTSYVVYVSLLPMLYLNLLGPCVSMKARNLASYERCSSVIRQAIASCVYFMLNMIWCLSLGSLFSLGFCCMQTFVHFLLCAPLCKHRVFFLEMAFIQSYCSTSSRFMLCNLPVQFLKFDPSLFLCMLCSQHMLCALAHSPCPCSRISLRLAKTFCIHNVLLDVRYKMICSLCNYNSIMKVIFG